MQNGLFPSRFLGLGLAVSLLGAAISRGQDPCDPDDGNPVACENQKVGSDPSEWEVTGVGDPPFSYAIPFSGTRRTGSPKVNTTATSWKSRSIVWVLRGELGTSRRCSPSS
jgi:hypothetical protein